MLYNLIISPLIVSSLLLYRIHDNQLIVVNRKLKYLLIICIGGIFTSANWISNFNSYSMTILEQILAGLQTKFTGVDTAILTRIATKKAEGITDETKVNSIVEGISFSDVLNSYGDFRAGDASKTAVSNYEKKHNLKDGKSIENPNPNPNPNPKLEDKTDDMAAIIANAVSAAVKPLSDKLENPV